MPPKRFTGVPAVFQRHWLADDRAHIGWRGMVLTNMGGYGGLELGGSTSAIRDSRIGSRTLAVELAADSAIDRTSIGCTFHCVDLGDRNRLVDSVVSGYEAVIVDGDGNLLSNNEIRGGLIAIDGDTNIVRGNMLLGGGAPAIGGTKNIVDGNLILPDADGTVQVGIEFTEDGNFYGNNRVSAEVPFAHGGTVQTDWGGNVAFAAEMAARSPPRNQ